MNSLLKLLSIPSLQLCAEFLLRISLKLMNIGEGQSVSTSGEKNVIEYINLYTRTDTEPTDPTAPLIIFDVGAHTGEWLHMCATTIKPAHRIYSFEPSPASFSELNKCKSAHIICEQIGFGDSQGILYMQKETDGESTSQILNTKTDTSISISIDTIDAYCKKNNIGHIDLLKLDVEGYELKILDGAKDMIQNGKIKMIQFEFGAPSNEPYSLHDFFVKLSGYKIYRILQKGLYQVQDKHYNEIHTVTNFLAIEKSISKL